MPLLHFHGLTELVEAGFSAPAKLIELGKGLRVSPAAWQISGKDTGFTSFRVSDLYEPDLLLFSAFGTVKKARDILFDLSKKFRYAFVGVGLTASDKKIASLEMLQT
jgi:hypothetical protein